MLDMQEYTLDVLSTWCRGYIDVNVDADEAQYRVTVGAVDYVVGTIDLAVTPTPWTKRHHRSSAARHYRITVTSEELVLEKEAV